MATITAQGRRIDVSPGLVAWFGVLAAIIVLGFVSFIRQTVDGHQLTGLSNNNPWGLYISGFVFFIGTSAGATIVGFLIHAFGRKDYEPLATRALIVGLMSLMAAVLFIAVDVGSILRMVRLPIVWRNETSMFTYTSASYYLFGLLLAAEIYLAVKTTLGKASDKEKRWAKVLAIAAVPFALIIVHAATGSLFAVVKAREFWNTPLLPPHFAVVALLSGTAALTIAASAGSAVSGRPLVSRETLSHMGIMLGLFISIAAFLDLFDFIVFSYSDTITGNTAWEFLSGPNLAFSIVHVGGYIVALSILMSKRGRETPWLTVAAAVAFIAVAAYRYNLTIVGQAPPLMPFLEDPSYAPTWVEGSVAAGIMAFVLLGYSVLTRVLPMEEPAGPLSDIKGRTP
ncbi:MAG: NrfD/PsrC family molybdoenzyme membrane anchor subunit [Gemmatimonadota bacterium]